MSPTIPFVPDDAPFTSEQRDWLNGFLAGIYSVRDALLVKASSTSLKIAILFATQSGTSERLAKKLVKELKQKGHTPELSSLDSYTPASLAEQTHALILASTYGEGDPPDGAQAFAESICLLSAPRLDNLRYAVFALGDTSYEHFCKFGADLDTRFYALGGTRLCDRVDSGVDVDVPFERWKTTVLSSLTESPGSSSSALGGSILPIALSQSRQHTGSYRMGFIAYAALAVVILLMLRLVSLTWTKTWVGAGGRALTDQTATVETQLMLVPIEAFSEKLATRSYTYFPTHRGGLGANRGATRL